MTEVTQADYDLLKAEIEKQFGRQMAELATSPHDQPMVVTEAAVAIIARLRAERDEAYSKGVSTANKRVSEAHEAVNAKAVEILSLRTLLGEAVGALEPFARAAQVWSFSTGPDGLDDCLTVLAKVHVRPEYEVTLSTNDFRKASDIVGRVKEAFSGKPD